MQQVRDGEFPGRRRFLKQAMAVGGCGVLVLFAAGENDAEQSQTDVTASADVHTHKGYRLTAHIRTYYDTTRS